MKNDFYQSEYWQSPESRNLLVTRQMFMFADILKSSFPDLPAPFFIRGGESDEDVLVSSQSISFFGNLNASIIVEYEPTEGLMIFGTEFEQDESGQASVNQAFWYEFVDGMMTPEQMLTVIADCVSFAGCHFPKKSLEQRIRDSMPLFNANPSKPIFSLEEISR